MVEIFDKDDTYYQDWLKGNHDGYVINTRRNMPPSYMVLHRSDCRLISQYNKMAQPGGFTERQYIKVCSDSVKELRDWVCNNGRPEGSFSNECGICKPMQATYS